MSVYMALGSSKGTVSRAPAEGGDQERSLPSIDGEPKSGPLADDLRDTQRDSHQLQTGSPLHDERAERLRTGVER